MYSSEVRAITASNDMLQPAGRDFQDYKLLDCYLTVAPATLPCADHIHAGMTATFTIKDR